MNPLPTIGQIALSLWASERKVESVPRISITLPHETAPLAVPPSLVSVAAFRASLALAGESL